MGKEGEGQRCMYIRGTAWLHGNGSRRALERRHNTMPRNLQRGCWSHTNPEEEKYTKMNLQVHQFPLAINASNSSPLAPTRFLFVFPFSLLDFFWCTRTLTRLASLGTRLPLSIQYGVATTSRLRKITGLFCKRALEKRLYSAKETYNFKEPTNRSHPIPVVSAYIYPVSITKYGIDRWN